ncbi:YqaA family protein [Psychromonas sp. KJ10-10]|uniref:YqaA family protein n=1 Tax=Psychromonas sp. KJ10-10 TaxID=3391823 RepID=UPI0039B4B2E3
MSTDSLFAELVSLFISGFISSTLFPGGSEILLIYYVKNNSQNYLLYFVFATAGNSAGAMFTYLMGYYFHWGREKTKHLKTYQFCHKYGVYGLLFSWLPIVGDLLPLVAGWLKLPVFPSLLFIIIGKALRYGLIITPVLYFIK